MPPLNEITIAAAANGSTSHTIDPSSATGKVAGSEFSPTPGRLLVAVVSGQVTSDDDGNWTTGAERVGGTGLYMFHKTAASPLTLPLTHGAASNYPILVHVMEFAEGSTVIGGVGATVGGAASPNPTLTGLPGTPVEVYGAVDWGDLTAGGTTGSAIWDGPNVEVMDYNLDATNGIWMSICRQLAYTGTTYAPTPTITAPGSGSDSERITFAIALGEEPEIPVFTVDPVISGIARVGETISCDGGTTVPDADKTYQWQRSG